MRRAGIVSYRLRGADGVSIEAEKWAWALEHLGWEVRRIAGEGPGDVVVVPGLEMLPGQAVDAAALGDALDGCDLVVLENICSLPLNPAAGDALAAALRGRPAILRHHDLPWQRAATAAAAPPPSDPAWLHVTINELSRAELAERGIAASCIYNRFDLEPPAGDRSATREALGISEGELLLLQPTRALPRKGVPRGLSLAAELGATYWLTGAVEDGYEAELAALLAAPATGVLRGRGPGSIDDAYAASDAVVLPSTWEGFGNPIVESIAHRRPLALSRYPVAEEVRALGFRFFEVDDAAGLAAFIEAPDAELLDENLRLASLHFDLRGLPGAIGDLLGQLDLA